MLRPAAQFERFDHIDPAWLLERGIRAVLLDLDNTLVPYRAYGECPPELRAWLDSLHAAGIQTMLVSNGSRRRVRYWRELLGIPGFGPAGKPWFGFNKALRRLRLNASEVAMVGDQLFTDVLGGNLVGALTILVQPISKKELGYTRLIRRLERLILGTGNVGFMTGPSKQNEHFDPEINPESRKIDSED
ncbi:MAG: YqeG family HAD IIIA-type phosphatase [Meiothermus sp.]|nr:YqeG family HAD IIIA-type phosphatase [Meiothermus sp.]